MEVLIRSGDTLSYYSQLFMVPLQLILDANPKVIEEDLQIEKKIVIPGFQSVPYTIRSGETLSNLAASRNLSIDAIKLLNQTEDFDHLTIKEPILLPERIIKPYSQTARAYGYKTLKEATSYLKRVYPFITVTPIGSSVLGNSIEEIRVGKGAKKIHMNASFHANEWITTLVLMHLLNNYLLALTNSTPLRGVDCLKLYQNVELSIVPMVNPDGVDLVLYGPRAEQREMILKMNDNQDDIIHWKANIRGVDLNNQYPAKWEIEKQRKVPKSPAPRDYPGDLPLTEPEAIAMAELVKKNPFDCMIAFHTQGEEFYWGYEGHEPVEAEAIAKEFEQESGYQAIRYIDSHAGFKDWYIQEFKRPGFTIELGRGINPLPLSMFNDIYKRAEGIFAAALKFKLV